jgi:hypothetical protein
MISTLTLFEMRKNGLKNGTKIDTIFKARKSENIEDSNEEYLDDMEANFVRIMKKGTDKYKIKLPFKFFSYEDIGNYASKCPNRAMNNKNKENKGKMIKKSYYVREDACIFYVEYDYVNDDEFLFLALPNESTYANSKICVKESVSKKKDKVEGTPVSEFHSKQDKMIGLLKMVAQII